MKQFLRDYFTYNRKERRGIIFLLAIILLLTGYLSFSEYFFPPEKYDFSAFDRQVAELEKLQHPPQDSLDESKYTYDQNDYKLPVPGKNKDPERFNFNPNHLPESDWLRLGLTEKQVKSIKNYEAKGGKFKTKEDVKKMYLISETLYHSLEPYIRIPEDSSKKEVKADLTKEEPLMELNSADSTELIRIKGIGPYTSKGIVKYRNLLGGYVAVKQLKEVYGMHEESYTKISDKFYIDSSKVIRININTATVDQMKKHPYIKYNLANLIVNYRQQHGNYKKVEDIKKLDLVNDELFAKLAPYLTIE